MTGVTLWKEWSRQFSMLVTPSWSHTGTMMMPKYQSHSNDHKNKSLYSSSNNNDKNKKIHPSMNQQQQRQYEQSKTSTKFQFPFVSNYNNVNHHQHRRRRPTNRIHEYRSYAAFYVRICYNAVLRLCNNIRDSVLQYLKIPSVTEILDSVTKSTPRFLVLCNFIFAIAYMLHEIFVESFLAHSRSNSTSSNFLEVLASYFLFKLLLVSAIVEPDALDAFILLLWYTTHSFLRSLSILTQECVMNSVHRGVQVNNRVVWLWLWLMVWNWSSVVVCYTLFHSAGLNLVLVLMADCVLLMFDLFATAICYCDHWSSTHSNVNEVIEGDNNGDEQNRNQHLQVWNMFISFASYIFSSQQQPHYTLTMINILKPMLELCHYLHLWLLHFRVGIVGCIVMSKCYSHARSITREMQNYRRQVILQSQLDILIPDYPTRYSSCTSSDSNESDQNRFRDKLNEEDDLCCICLNQLSVWLSPSCNQNKALHAHKNIKKLDCGHMYHSYCLRQVVERAPSLESAKCPMCRSLIIPSLSTPPSTSTTDASIARIPDDSQPRFNRNNLNNNTDGNNNDTFGDQHVFRFSTEGIVPAWVPLPAFSFEVVRRRNTNSAEVVEAWGSGRFINNQPEQEEGLAQVQSISQEEEGQRYSNDNMDVHNDRNNNNREEHIQDHVPGGVWSRFVSFFSQTMTEEEERAVLNQLSDMFPQYSRSDLQRELQRLGNAELVVESIFHGRFERRNNLLARNNHIHNENQAIQEIVDTREQDEDGTAHDDGPTINLPMFA